MLRSLHSLPGLFLAVILVVISLTGAVLAFDAALEHARGVASMPASSSVAAVAEKAAANRPGLERLERKPSGIFVVHYSRDGVTLSERIDVATGRTLETDRPSALMQTITRLHRSLLLDKPGRGIAGLCALATLVLTLSGAMLLAAKAGGWRGVLRPIRGSGPDRRHASLARFALIGLLVSGVTGCYLSLVSFDVIPEVTAAGTGEAPSSTAGRRLPVGRLPALRQVDAASLRELTFPRRDEPSDVYRLVTDQGAGRVDAVSGALIDFQAPSMAGRVHETMYMLHTGRGVWPLALVLGLTSLAVPVLAWTGAAMWWRRMRMRPRIAANAPARLADTIIVVGSEGGATWRFAAAVHRALRAAGFKVHTVAMDRIGGSYPRAERMLIFASTYGDGAPPASGRRFLARLPRINRKIPVAVLGFGDRSFPRFCKFADDIARMLKAHGWPELLPTARIDRQSPQQFAQWIAALAGQLRTPLAADATDVIPDATRLVLAERADYGEDVQAPTAILRFGRPNVQSVAGWRARWRSSSSWPQFEAGDLVGIVPPGGHAPRLYSIASSSEEGVLEICVRKQPGGLCSNFLHDLDVGAAVEAFVRPNPAFRLARGTSPVILVGAGAGIGPLVGLIRGNARRRPMHLYWGGRHPAHDFLYEGELSYYLGDRRLTRLRATFTRIANGLYVQERIAREAAVVRDLIRNGAHIMVCGSRQMGEEVAATFDHIVRPLGLDLEALKAQGRYVEDVY